MSGPRGTTPAGVRPDLWRAALDGDPAALTRLLVSIPSVNPALSARGSGEAAVAEACAALLAGWGLDVTVSGRASADGDADEGPPRPNVVAVLGGGLEDDGPLLVLNGHLDTVGVEGMTVEPFGAQVRDGRILGRGACDMKAGVAALMAAAAATAGRGGPGAGTLVVALTADEEHASIGMQAFAGELRRRLDGAPRDPAEVAAVVCEPTGLAVMPAHKGFVWLDAVFRGRAAHGSRPEVGVDAVRHAALWIASLEGLHGDLEAGPPHPLLGHPSFHVGTIEGGTAPSVYPAGCRVTVERRTLPAEDPDEVVEPFRRALGRVARDHPDVSAELSVDMVRPGSDVSPESTVVRSLGAALREEGMEVRIEGMTAWVDAAFLNEAGVPAVCFGPGSIEQAHSADESVDLGEIRAAAEVLGRLVEGFLRP